jgi:hypothetical protein
MLYNNHISLVLAMLYHNHISLISTVPCLITNFITGVSSTLYSNVIFALKCILKANLSQFVRLFFVTLQITYSETF